ncbi:MAG: hypothetical protein PHN72_05845 [Bacilli bacterium]|nr:hypothetical protein [Bacilli bacterium]
MTEMPVVRKKFKKEYGADFDELLEMISDLKSSASNTSITKLESTKVFQIDRTIESLQLEAIKNNITFDFKMRGKFTTKYITDEILDAKKISTLLSDHVKNAFISINYPQGNWWSWIWIYDFL